MKSFTQKFLAAPLTLMLIFVASYVHGQALSHRYSFSDPAGNAQFIDSIGGASWSGTTVGTAALDGSSLLLDGVGGFATLPSGMVSSYSQVTIEFWADFGPNNPFWTRVFAFGDQNGSGGQLTGLDYCHYAGGNWQNLNFGTAASSVYANNPGGLNDQTNVHVTVVVDPVNNQMLYYNGTTVPSTLNGSTVPPLNTLNDAFCLIGKSLHDIDALLEGSITEFRIYDGAVTPAIVALNDAAGPDNYVVDPGAIQSVHLISPVNPLVINENSQQIFSGDFVNVSGVNLNIYGGATFSSGNTNVLTVNPTNGLVRAVGAGTTTLIASYGGMSATNSITVIALPATLTHRYSFTGDANDSVGGAHGTLQGAAAISEGKVVLDGSFDTYVNLPGAEINIATNKSVTIEAWVDFGDVPFWSRLFNFGNDGGSSELYFAPNGPGNGSQHRISQNFAGGRTIDWRGALANLSAHIAIVIDPPTSTLAVYRDGLLEYARHDASAALSLVSTSLAVIGRSLVGADPYMPGAVDEFRIYSGALTPSEVERSFRSGPNSVNHDPGALSSIDVAMTEFPAFSGMLPPGITATYANLTNHTLLPNNSAVANGLIITSSDTNIVQVRANNMLRTLRPGTVTLTASYLGKTDSAMVTIRNTNSLTHRYSFNGDANDSVGTAHGVLQGSGLVADGNLVLDGVPGTYLELPAGLIDGYDAVTVEMWVTIFGEQRWARLLYFGDDRANEFYMAPSVQDGSNRWFSTGFPQHGVTLSTTRLPAFENQMAHITCIYGNGSMEFRTLYAGGRFVSANNDVLGRLSQVGNSFSWIGRSPHGADPYLNCSISEVRIYRGRLAPDEMEASNILGPDQLLSNIASLAASSVGGNTVLSWPIAAAGFSIQTKDSLSNGDWAISTNAPTIVGDHWQVTVPASESAQFFRLWR